MHGDSSTYKQIVDNPPTYEDDFPRDSWIHGFRSLGGQSLIDVGFSPVPSIPDDHTMTWKRIQDRLVMYVTHVQYQGGGNQSVRVSWRYLKDPSDQERTMLACTTDVMTRRLFEYIKDGHNNQSLLLNKSWQRPWT